MRSQEKQKGGLFLIKQVLLGIFDATLLIFLGIFLAVFLVYNFGTPSAQSLTYRNVPQTSVIYDRTGEHVLYEIHGEENRKIISHNEIPDVMRIATIATEDREFYNHPGVNPFSIMRALSVNISNEGIRQGGSTITQQLVRSVYLTNEKTLKRKFTEAVLALKMEMNFSKDQILDFYLNQIPYGANSYGIQSASQTYFGKNANELTLDEAAFLAALPKAPSYYSPYNVHTDELIERQKNILKRMDELKLINKNDAEVALKENTLAKVIPLRAPIAAPHFVFYVIEQIEKEYGKNFLETGGLKVYTSLDWNMQEKAEKVIANGVERNFSRGATNAGLVAVNPQNGDILAMVGSRNYFDESIDGQVNVTLSPRQPGSAFKPFAYAKAFEKGYQPETMILDSPTNFGPDGGGRPYVPRNYDGKFHGLLSMREALAQSLNVPAVKTLYLAGIDETIELAHRLGITTLNDRPRYGLSLVLGGGEVKLLDMASAFSVFANDGIRNPAQAVIKITDNNGKVYAEKKNNPQQVLNPQIARRINSILSDNTARTPIFGPKSPLILDGKTVAAKTGTTQEFKDAWTVGYTPSLAVGVWAGNNNGRPMKAGSDGVFVAAPIWNEYMKTVLADAPNQSFIAYDKEATKKKDGEDIAGAAMIKKVTYYNVKSGERVSEERVKRMSSEKVKKKIREKVEYIPVEGENISQEEKDSAMNIALPNPNDPMYKRWNKDMINSFLMFPFSGFLNEKDQQ